MDQWVRNVGAEQELRGGAEVISLAPGTVDTEMQTQLRAVDEANFTQREKFVKLHQSGGLADPKTVAASIWRLLSGGVKTGSVLDLRDLPG